MIKKFRNHRRGIAAVAILGMLVSGAFAYTAANVVPANKAGEGSHAITGYTVSNIHYTTHGTANPLIIDTIEFDVNSTPVAGSTAFVRAYTAGVWYACSISTAHITCDTTGTSLTVANTDTLDVVVAD